MTSSRIGKLAATLRPMTAPADSTLAPHPTLHRYYSAPESKPRFLKDIFDHTACDYDRVEKIIGLGTGGWYRRRSLRQAGLLSGMRVLDVAVGTGLVAREAIRIVGSPNLVIGIDPSIGMLSRAVERLNMPAILGIGEQLPIADQSVDFVSMGYALRHLSNLPGAFAQYRRVLKPEGRLCILEITRPRTWPARWLTRLYMRRVVPGLTRLTARSSETKRLWEYYSDTVEACVPPHSVIDALNCAGFTDVQREVEIGIFSMYCATRR